VLELSEISESVYNRIAHAAHQAPLARRVRIEKAWRGAFVQEDGGLGSGWADAPGSLVAADESRATDFDPAVTPGNQTAVGESHVRASIGSVVLGSSVVTEGGPRHGQ
jgi:hypothetical protein